MNRECEIYGMSQEEFHNKYYKEYSRGQRDTYTGEDFDNMENMLPSSYTRHEYLMMCKYDIKQMLSDMGIKIRDSLKVVDQFNNTHYYEILGYTFTSIVLDDLHDDNCPFTVEPLWFTNRFVEVIED